MTSSDITNSDKIDGGKESAWWIAGTEQQVTDMQTEDWQDRETSSQQMDRDSQSFSGRKKKGN